MSKQAKSIIEYRNYELPENFPILLLTGERWHISDIKSGRLHFHNCLEIGLCHSESGTMEFEDTPFSFHADDVTIVACDIPHTTYSSPGTASRWSYLFVDVEEFLHPFFPIDALPHSQILIDLIHNFRRIMPKAEYPFIYDLVHRMVTEMQEKKMNYQVSVRGLFVSLITELMRLRSDSAFSQAYQAPENTLVIAPALDYIKTNYMHSFSIDYLADLCHLSPTHFRRLFHGIMDTSPLEFINTTRILKASSMLRTTEYSILTVSERVGFHSISSFNRHFSALLGISPKEWRKKMSVLKNQSVLEYTGWM